MPEFQPSESQLVFGAAHSLSTHKLARDAGRGLGELNPLAHLFDTEEEDWSKPLPRHVLAVSDVTRGLGLDREVETLVERMIDSTRTDFNRQSGSQRLVGARGLLLSWLRNRADEIPAPARLEIVRRADAYWRRRGADDMRTTKSFAKSALHKYVERKPDGKGGWTYSYDVKLSKPQLDRTLKNGTYSIISAGRNGEDSREKDMPHNHAEFHERHEKLRAELHKRGLRHTEVEGHYGSKEPSFIVYHAHEKKPSKGKGRSFLVHHDKPSEFALIRKLGKKYNQDSVIHSKRGAHELHYTTGEKSGKHVKGAGHEYKPHARDFYTRVKTPGHASKFALNFAWEQLHAKREAMLKHRFVISLRKGEQGGHKYVSKKPDGKGGWEYSYDHEAAHTDRIANAQHEYTSAMQSLVDAAKEGKTTAKHGNAVAEANRSLELAHARLPDHDRASHLTDASEAAHVKSDHAHAGRGSHKGAANAHWAMAEKYRLLGHHGYIKHESAAEDHERIADEQGKREAAKEAGMEKLRAEAAAARKAKRAPKKPPFKIGEKAERVREGTYAFDVDAGKKGGQLRVTVYPNNTMRIYAPNSGVDWLQSDLHEKDQAELVKRANALRASEQAKKSYYAPSLRKADHSGHKYASKKPDGHGGWRYEYNEGSSPHTPVDSSARVRLNMLNADAQTAIDRAASADSQPAGRGKKKQQVQQQSQSKQIAAHKAAATALLEAAELHREHGLHSEAEDHERAAVSHVDTYEDLEGLQEVDRSYRQAMLNREHDPFKPKSQHVVTLSKSRIYAVPTKLRPMRLEW